MSSTPPGATPAPASPPPPSNTTSPPPSPAATSPPTTTPSPPPPTPSAPPPSTTSSPPPPSTSSPPPSSSASPPSPAAESPPPPSLTPSPPTSTPSPPPPPSSPDTASPPPPPRNSGNSSPPPPSSATDSSNGVSTGLIVGITIGGVAILLVLGMLFICCKKKRRRRHEESYYAPPPRPGPKDGPYGGQQYRWQLNPPPRMEQYGAVAPQPTPPPVTAWRPPSPGQSAGPPPPFMSSSTGGSGSNNYSGSGNPLPPPSAGISLGFSKSTFSYEELAMATDGFSDANLLGQGRGRPTMDWPTRLRIALGSAKGLAYLHEDCHPKIIHRDIKTANILLDFKFEAMVADFGLAKINSDVNTHVSTRVMGTFGYLAPEYASSGKLTDKSDVFSFGVMLLELITGHRPVGSSLMEDSLVDWARPLLGRALDEGNFDGLVDPKLQKEFNHNEMTRMVACAAACVRHSARRRPRMSQIVRALEGDASLSDLNEGMRPGQSGIYSSHGSSDYDTSQYNEDMKKFRKMALGTQEYVTSSEYSEPTSEYGLYPSGSSNEVQTTREMEMGRMKKNSYGFSGNSTSTQ
ncbi:hypothetical protein V6N12_052988 [Hibiscus sabdariffa]|uniref:non-specific serine/threonine protein kinase n=1 Tax=Hibiscus sabdariffa TaxID=183260 RepID=A0ABR2C360_9ROSI